jgi:hypothetical protein
LGDERTHGADLVLLFALTIGELEHDTALLGLIFHRVGVGRAPGALRARLGETNGDFLLSLSGQDSGESQAEAGERTANQGSFHRV